MDQTALLLLLVDMLLGGLQGRLAGNALSLQKRLCRWLGHSPKPDGGRNLPGPPSSSAIASWILTAILVSSPGVAWCLWLFAGRQYSPVFPLFSIALFLATAVERIKRTSGADLVRDSCQSARRLPVIVLFGVFSRRHPATDAFLEVLDDRRVRSLWTRFERISVDFERDAALAEKYGYEPEKGVQIALFGRTAERTEVAGKDCLAGAELMQASTLAEWLRRIDADRGSDS